MTNKLLLFVLLLGLCALAVTLHPVVKSLIIVACCLAATVHFSLRIFRNLGSHRSRAAAVSCALAFLSLGPAIVAGLVRGAFPVWLMPKLEAGAFLLSVGLVVAILRVEMLDEARKRQKQAAREDAETMARIRDEVGAGRTAKRQQSR